MSLPGWSGLLRLAASVLPLLGLGWLLARQGRATGRAEAREDAAQGTAKRQKEMLDAASDRPFDRADRARRLRSGDF